ncbi:MAG TPA: hypothetical protein VN843_01535 [Anaerolineales bacterium]|nr:hypothetical protein [Anaerolineales bacterium]
MNDYSRSGYEDGSFKEVPNTTTRDYKAKPYPNKGSRHSFNRLPSPVRDFNTNPPTLYKPYVGTGNADTPDGVMRELLETAQLLERNGYTVRTSAFFDTPDKVFSQIKTKEMILPWKGFADQESKLTFTSEEARYLAKKYYANPAAFDTMKEAGKTFLAKNVRLICGQNLRSPAQFVLLWTEDGCEHPKDKTPKTGYAISIITISYEMRIPIFNFGRSDAKQRLTQKLQLENP